MGSGVDKLTDCYDIIPFIDVDHKNIYPVKSYCVKHTTNDNFTIYESRYIHRGTEK